MKGGSRVKVTATSENVDGLFEGVMLAVSDIGCDSYSVPGWRCRRCGWTIGSQGLPPSHECPAEIVQSVPGSE